MKKKYCKIENGQMILSSKEFFTAPLNTCPNINWEENLARTAAQQITELNLLNGPRLKIYKNGFPDGHLFSIVP